MRLLQIEHGTRNKFKITERGKEFLEKWSQLQNLVNDERKPEIML
jgi:predicted transcriptional regulator